MQQQNTELYKWYIIHTHSGFEAKVINNIKEEIKKKKAYQIILRIFCSYSKDFGDKKGKKVEGEKSFIQDIF